MLTQRTAYSPVLALVCTLLLGGCATSRGTLAIPRGIGTNPSTGIAVKLVRVTDNRVFEIKPSNASIPSLKGGEISDTSITARAIARKRNSYGKALGDILLPEGDTVEQLARTALTHGFREAGWRVLAEGEIGYDDAVPLEADIQQFWGWFSPGFFAAHLEFEARIVVSGPIRPFEQGEEFRGYVRLSTQGASSRAWSNTVNKGLDDLERAIQKRLRELPGTAY